MTTITLIAFLVYNIHNEVENEQTMKRINKLIKDIDWNGNHGIGVYANLKIAQCKTL